MMKNRFFEEGKQYQTRAGVLVGYKENGEVIEFPIGSLMTFSREEPKPFSAGMPHEKSEWKHYSFLVFNDKGNNEVMIPLVKSWVYPDHKTKPAYKVDNSPFLFFQRKDKE